MTPDKLLAYSGEHLLYEFVMLQYVADSLEARKEVDALKSALVESWAIHLRALIFFFCDAGKPDDVVAKHFFENPDEWTYVASNTLQLARERANKEVGHLTTQRKSDSDKDKPWLVRALTEELRELAKYFASKASPKRLHPQVKEFLATPWTPELRAIWVQKNFTFSNTSASTLSFSTSGPSVVQQVLPSSKPSTEIK